MHGAVREDVKVCQLRKEQQEKSTVRYYTADYLYKRKSACVIIAVKYNLLASNHQFVITSSIFSSILGLNDHQNLTIKITEKLLTT